MKRIVLSLAKIRWGLGVAAAAAATTSGIGLIQGVSAPTLVWRSIISFGLVLAFQWSLLTAWDVLEVEPLTHSPARARQASE